MVANHVKSSHEGSQSDIQELIVLCDDITKYKMLVDDAVLEVDDRSSYLNHKRCRRACELLKRLSPRGSGTALNQGRTSQFPYTPKPFLAAQDSQSSWLDQRFFSVN